MANQPGVLCYPNFNLNDLNGVKHSLLFSERVSVIAPTQTPGYQVPMTPVELVKGEPGGITPYGTGIGFAGALASLADECKLHDGTSAIEFIDDGEIAKLRADEFVSALGEDLEAPEVATWEARVRSRHPTRDYAWYVNREYFNNFLGLDVEDSRYRLEAVADKRFGDLIKVPFVVGMSLGLSGALWAAVDKNLSLFTLDPTSADFLLLRLQRGWRLLRNDPTLQRNLDIKLAKGFATSQFSTWTLEFRVPDLFRKIPPMSLQQVIDMRRLSDKTQALADFRDGMARIVSECGLWQAKDFQAFRHAAEDAADTVLKPAYETLDQGKFDIKDIVRAFDPSTGAQSFFKDIPKLFVGGVAGTVALTSGIALVPAALFALGCGLVGSAVARFIEGQRERLAQQHRAQFLTYAIRLGEVMK